MDISKEDILKLAQLSRLELTAEEVALLSAQLPNIVEYVSQLQTIDAPTTVANDAPPVPLRTDEVIASTVTSDILAQAPERQDDFWKVDAVFS